MSHCVDDTTTDFIQSTDQLLDFIFGIIACSVGLVVSTEAQ